MTDVLALHKFPIHLGLGAVAAAQPAFDGIAWYEAYGKRNAADGDEGRLVTMWTFEEPWNSWEMHPRGDEVVVCISGSITLVQEVDGAEREIILGPGEYAINAPGVWHTADVDAPATALFITAGAGTEQRPR